MKGNEKLIEELNKRLAEELTAINQYMVHAEMCDNWKYSRLHEAIRKRAIVEMPMPRSSSNAYSSSKGAPSSAT